MPEEKSSLLEYAVKELKNENENLKETLDNSSKDILKQKNLLLLQSSALEAAANGIVITDKDGSINWVNFSFTKLTGYTFEEVVNKNLRMLKSGAHDNSFYAEMWDTILNGNVWNGEVINKKKDGTLYTEEMTITPVLNKKGEITNFIAIKQDISERKRYEKELIKNKNSVEYSALGILWVNLESELIYANHTILKSLGYSADELKNLKVSDLDPLWPTKEYFDDKLKLLRKNNRLNFESINIKKDGTEFPVHVSLKIIKTGSEEMIVAYVEDISKKKAIREVENLLINSNSLDEFLAGMHAALDKVITAPNCYVALLNNETETISFRYFVDQFDEKPKPRSKRKGLTEYIIRSGKSILLTQELLDDLVAKGEVESIGSIPSSYIGIPLFAETMATGALVLQSYDDNVKYSKADLNWLESIGTLISSAIQRKVIESRLIQNQKSVEDAAFSVIWYDTNGNIKYANKLASIELGYTKDELLSLSILDLSYEKLEIEDWQRFIDDLKEKSSIVHECENRTKNGSPVPVEITSKLFNFEGEEYVVSYIHNITNRKEAEKLLRESEHKFKAVTDSAKDAITTIDKNKKVVVWNRAAVELFGYSVEEAEGQSIHDLIIPKRFLNESKERFKKFSSLGKDFKGTFQFTVNKKDGTEFEADLSVSLTEIDNNWYITAIWRDLTQKTEIENKTDEEKDKIINDLKNELALAQSNYNVLNSVLQQLPQSIYVKDKNSRFIKVNKATLDKLGFKTEEEIIGKTDLDVFDKEVAEQFIKEEKIIIETGYEIIGKEHTEKMQNGEERWAQTSKFPLLNKDGNTIGMFGISTDLTERKKMENELRDRDYKFKKLIENSTLGIMRLDEDGEIIMANPALVNMLGYKSETDLISTKTNRIYASANNRLKFLQTLKREEKISGFEDVLLKSDSTPMDVRESAWAVKDHDDRILYYEIIVEDITEQNQVLRVLHESEFKYRMLIDKLSEAVFLKIGDKFEVVNKKFLEIFEIREEDLYQSDFDIYNFMTEESKQLLQERNELIKQGETVPKVYEITIITSSGNEKEVEVSVSFLNFNGRTAVQGVMRDLTITRKQETQIRHLQKMEAIGTLAAGIAHEINTPSQFVNDNLSFLKDTFKEVEPILTTVKNLNGNPKVIEDLKESGENADLDYLLDEIPVAIDQSLDGVKRIAEIVSAMRDFAHSGPKDKISADVHKIINNSITLSKNAWKYVAEIETEFDESIPNIVCQPNDLNQVIVNMIVNASHAIENRFADSETVQGKIKIQTVNNADYIDVLISDNGNGMPEKVMKRIFDPFYTTKEVGKGTGQGLAIAYDIIVAKHNGEINVDSEEGVGTTFSISIPVDQPTEAE